MDHYTIFDQTPVALAAEEASLPVLPLAARKPASPKMATASAQLPQAWEERHFPEEDGGENEAEPTLAQMAAADLDAALQLLADRAQYITGASGAAIALRRGEHHDMLCRASAGSSAPELGAVLSMDHGLSGECVRTRQALRCDDASEDLRVNREVCIELGIASVVVIPIVSEDAVLGVFELFSGKPHAFGERDLSTLSRLSQLVETAVKHAAAFQVMAVAETGPEAAPPVATATELKGVVSVVPAVMPASEARFANESNAGAAAAKETLLWSAAGRGQAAVEEERLAPSAASFGAQKLPNCQACGFPVSPGRTLCVECEEKKWRGHGSAENATAGTLPQSAQQMISAQDPLRRTFIREAATAPAPDPANARAVNPASAAIFSGSTPSMISLPTAKILSGAEPGLSALKLPETAAVPPFDPAIHEVIPEEPAPFLSSAMQSRSWFQENKYIVITLLLVGIAAAVVNWLR
jgi:hypothetical protein